MTAPGADFVVFSPDDVDLNRSPLRHTLRAETYVLGAFNPGFTRLPNGNLLMMVRVAEALRAPIVDGRIHAIRWEPGGRYVLDGYPTSGVDAKDPRKFRVLGFQARVVALTSLSWLLPVEMNEDGSAVVAVHYDRAIAPVRSYQEYGVEDARISRIGGNYYMTTCSVSAERHATTLYTSSNGLDYELQGIVLDHQNKDMLFFEGMPGGMFHALTRPLGDLYFAYPPDSPFQPGPAIHLARSPDGLHWKPLDMPFLRARKGSISAMKIGGGTPPIRTRRGWLMLYHGVEPGSIVGIYRTFWALLDLENPAKILRLEDGIPLLEPNAELTEPYQDRLYVTDVVYTTGIVEAGDHYILASGEADLVCRLTLIPRAVFD